MRTKRKRRLLSVMLCLCMLFSVFPMSGMTYAAETPEVPCTMDCPEVDGQTVHAEGCAYSPVVPGTPCKHEQGEHDENCGYIEAVDGAPCTHTCELCDGSAESTTEDSKKAESDTQPENHEGECEMIMVQDGNPVVYGSSPIAAAPGGNAYDGNSLATALGGGENVTVNGDTVTLNKDVNLNSYVLFWSTPVTLDLNGYTLGASDSLDVRGYGSMLPVSGVTLTIKNGNIRSNTADAEFSSIWVYSGGCINLENVDIEGDVKIDESSTFQANTSLAVRGQFLVSGTVKIANGATLDLKNSSIGISNKRTLVIFKADNNEAWDTDHPLIMADEHTSDHFFTLDTSESGLPEGYHLAYALNGGTSEWKLQPPGYTVSYNLASHLQAESTQGSVAPGDTLNVKLIAKDGYHITSGSVNVFAVENGEEGPTRTKRAFTYNEATGALTVENVTTDLYIQVLEKIIVTLESPENGRIEIEDTVQHSTYDSNFYAAYQEKIIIRCYPNPGYELSAIMVNGREWTSGSIYTVEEPTTIKAVIEPAQVSPEIPPKITTTTLESGLETAAYQELLGAGGSTPITWSVVKGRLPDGLALMSTGHIQGKPTASGIFTFTIRAKNSVGSDEREFTIEIRPLPDGGSTYGYETLTDPATGIKVSGLFSSDAALAVRANEVLHDKDACPACDDIRVRQEKGELLVLYDIRLSAGVYQGELEVTIPVGEASNGQNVYILHCNEKVLESRPLTVDNGFVTGMFTSLSPFAVVKAESKITVTGLPENYTLNVGQKVSWTPAPADGTWNYDKDYLEMTQDGSTYTFKALKAGKAIAVYTVDGVSSMVTVTINNSETPASYTLTFETNGGSRIDGIKKASGTVIDLSEYKPTREGYEFGGWYADKDFKNAVTSVTLDSDKTIYAKWTANAEKPEDPKPEDPKPENPKPGNPPSQPEKTTPQTGDTSNTLPFLLLALVSLLGCIGLISYKKLVHNR